MLSKFIFNQLLALESGLQKVARLASRLLDVECYYTVCMSVCACMYVGVRLNVSFVSVNKNIVCIESNPEGSGFSQR